MLLRDRRWLIASGPRARAGSMYVAALRLAPLALVQAVAASGVVVLAFATRAGTRPGWRGASRSPSSWPSRLVLLALSLVDTAESDQHPAVIGTIIWLAACGGGAVLLIAVPTRFGRAASLGLAAGLLFADGDISAKLDRLRRGVAARAAHAHRRVRGRDGVLQSAYQRGDALTAAGTATMVTNAVPIAAGFVLFGETLPHGARAVLQVAAFACLVMGAVALGHQQPPPAAADPAPRADSSEAGAAILYRGPGPDSGDRCGAVCGGRRAREARTLSGLADQLHRPGQAAREIAAQLAKSRLVTLTGPGGAGRSGLAGEVAKRAPAGRQRVWLAGLAAVRVRAQVPAARGRGARDP